MQSSPLAMQLLLIAENLNLYSSYIIFFVGLLGNVLNIIVLSKVKIFRGNCCAFYIFVESIISLFLLLQYIINEFFQIIYQTDPASLSLIYCKIRTTLGQSCRILIACIVCFEALDQYLSTHHRFNVRQMSTLKLARYLIAIATIFCIAQTIPYIIFYDIIRPYGCIITNQGLKIYYSFVYYILLNGFLPIFISSLFSLLAYRNVRHLVRRQVPTERRKLDHQLTAMIFVRVVFFIIILLPYTIFRIYSLNTTLSPLDIVPYAIIQLTASIVASVLFFNYSVI